MTAALWLLRQLCSMIGHRGPRLNYIMDEGGDWMIRDCQRCGIVVFRAMHENVLITDASIKDLLDGWFVGWVHD